MGSRLRLSEAGQRETAGRERGGGERETGGGKGANASPVASVNPHHQEFGVRD